MYQCDRCQENFEWLRPFDIGSYCDSCHEIVLERTRVGTLVLFLGRSIEGILADARREFGDGTTVIVTRDDDQLQAPNGVEAVVAVSAFRPNSDERYTLITNGGTSQQLVPVIRALVEAGADFAAYDLQRDGRVELWSRKRP